MSNEKNSSSSYLPIGDYGLIGDLHTVALVGMNGSIDWCCMPRFDSPSVFGALLDAEKGGFFRIAPTDESNVKNQQLYFPETNVLLTRFLADNALAELTDFMPIKQTEAPEHQHVIIRSLAVMHGSLSFTLTCRPAFNYAQDEHTATISPKGVLFSSEHFNLTLASPVQLEADEMNGVRAVFTLHAGQHIHFLLESSRSGSKFPGHLSETAFREIFLSTTNYWRNWLSQCTYQGRWRERVQRSALALKLMGYLPSGALVAAPTTSLPESIGGSRNWDYRFTWIRDASFSLYSLLELGFTEEAEAFMHWLDKRCHEIGDGDTLQPMYGLRGEHKLTEISLNTLEGYRQSSPVRVGNGAYTQKQLDIYGELLDAIYIYDRHTAISYDLWTRIGRLLGWLEDHWQEADEGIWEVRGGPKKFLHSRVMSWVAFDRAIRIAQRRGWPAPLDKWQQIRSDIYTQIMEQGWNEKVQSFVQYYGSDAVDASALLMVITNFTSAKEPKMLATIERIEKELSAGALVLRYIPDEAASDGMTGTEGTFGACSFWLVESLARAGRLDDARLRLEKLLSFSNHLGLYSEEISSTGQLLGNFPQAFTHLALITACYHLDYKLNKQMTRVSPD